MLIKNAKFIVSQSDCKQCKNYNMPEIAVAGKSNVGKSSFINMLANQKSLAKTSSTPGRTRLLNYFEFNNGQFMLVDLPGYGYAKINDEAKKNWGGLIEGFLTNNSYLACVMVLVDIRHEPSALDKQMVAFLHHYSIPFCIIATKGDKLSRMQIGKQIQVLATAFATGKDNILVTSSLSRLGKEEVLEKIEKIINNFDLQEV